VCIAATANGEGEKEGDGKLLIFFQTGIKISDRASKNDKEAQWKLLDKKKDGRHFSDDFSEG